MDPETSQAEGVLGGSGSRGFGVPAWRHAVAKDEEQASCIKRSKGKPMPKTTLRGGPARPGGVEEWSRSVAVISGRRRRSGRSRSWRQRR
jgi:hypothetical protein